MVGGALAPDLQVAITVEEALDRVDDLARAGESVARVERRRAHADRVELGGQVEPRRAEARAGVGAE